MLPAGVAQTSASNDTSVTTSCDSSSGQVTNVIVHGGEPGPSGERGPQGKHGQYIRVFTYITVSRCPRMRPVDSNNSMLE